jgi:dynein assembly factor with WDR repeat domains 1
VILTGPIAIELVAKQAADEFVPFKDTGFQMSHPLPLTNCAFNKLGDKYVTKWRLNDFVWILKIGKRRCITGSYDRTCKIWSTKTGAELRSLEGHLNVVYTVAFNNPFGCDGSLRPSCCLVFAHVEVDCSDKVLTGSFDKTARVCFSCR